jgi:hypothetical protein
MKHEKIIGPKGICPFCKECLYGQKHECEEMKLYKETIKTKRETIKRSCDWCGHVKEVRQWRDTHYTVCIDCAVSPMGLSKF